MVSPWIIQLAINHSVSWSVPRQFNQPQIIQSVPRQFNQPQIIQSVPRQFNQPQIIQSVGQSPDNSISHKSFSQLVSPQTIQSATNHSVSWSVPRQFNELEIIWSVATRHCLREITSHSKMPVTHLNIPSAVSQS